ncbi:MAG: hypothetical protein M3126_00280 [Candidatus Eremiobacteraeota bacterium]|nr:hypothetical protein [Candidatus Eremiobacteraeota bacterium]
MAGALTVLLAGISEAIGQSVVLFVNRVSPARFALSLLINGVLIAAGFVFIVLSTWSTFLLPGARPVGLEALAIAVAFSYAPLLAAFLGALPYAGTAVLFALRIWQLLAMVVAVAQIAHIPTLTSAGHVALGWIAMLVAQHVLGKPLTAVSLRLADLAAGVHIVQEKVAVQRAVHQLKHVSSQVGSANAAQDRRRGSHGLPVFAGIITTFLIVAVIVAVLIPHHRSIAALSPGAILWRASFDIIWIALVGIVVAAFLAPLETLGWWAGWYGESVSDTAGRQPGNAAPRRAQESLRYVVYLDGISQSGSRYTPDIETFLDALATELPAGTQLVRGIVSYSVVNRPLDDDPVYARFWKWVEKFREGAKTQIIGMFINIRNVMIVAVSADQRYGPLYNLGIAQVIYNALIEEGYKAGSAVPVTMIGYSGGGQMCAEAAPLLTFALGVPIDVISLGGVMTGTAPFKHIDHLYHMKGSKDAIEPLGPIMFSSRWRIFMQSPWNKALRKGRITLIGLGPVGHQVPGGMLDPDYKLPSGKSALRNTLDHINSILTPVAP